MALNFFIFRPEPCAYSGHSGLRSAQDKILTMPIHRTEQALLKKTDAI